MVRGFGFRLEDLGFRVRCFERVQEVSPSEHPVRSPHGLRFGV